ncbi:MAG: Uma2 family endonuclease [Acidobacteriota bacterium]
MAEARHRLATWVDIAEPPEGENVEIVAGEVVVSPRSKPAHGRAQMMLAGHVGLPFDGDGDPGGWWIVIEPEVELSHHEVYIPDLAGWRRARVPVLPEERPVHVVPDWVCEVSSPSTSRLDRIRKAQGYLDAGVPFYWLLDIEARTLEALAAREGAWVRLGGWADEDTARIPPFEAIELRIGRFFTPTA